MIIEIKKKLQTFFFVSIPNHIRCVISHIKLLLAYNQYTYLYIWQSVALKIVIYHYNYAILSPLGFIFTLGQIMMLLSAFSCTSFFRSGLIHNRHAKVVIGLIYAFAWFFVLEYIVKITVFPLLRTLVLFIDSFFQKNLVFEQLQKDIK